jgi:hypothetical protein
VASRQTVTSPLHMAEDAHMTETCWDCGHPLHQHTTEYPGWDLRSIAREEWPAKRADQGCTVAGCSCRRWFENEQGRPIQQVAFDEKDNDGTH